MTMQAWTTSQRLDGKILGKPRAIPLTARDDGSDALTRPARARPERRGPAKILDMAQVPALFEWLDAHERVPEAAKLKFAMSFYEGLRAGEMARLTWSDVTDPNGAIAPFVTVLYGKGDKLRRVPMHECTRWALGEFRRRFPEAESLAICKANGKPQNADAVKVWFGSVYRRMGLEGCSSHTGRRSLITFLANNHGRLGMSLVDVQKIAGHEDLTSTQKYIQLSPDLHRLIEMVPWLPPRGAVPQAPPQTFAPSMVDQQARPPWRVDDPLRSFASGAWGGWRPA